MANPITVIIADDHAIVRMGFSSLIGTEPGLSVIGEAEDGESAVRLVRKLKPTVVVMDIMMPIMNGIQATAELRKCQPDAHIVILTTSNVSSKLQQAIDAGAEGAVLKSAANEELIKAIKSVAIGKTFISPEIKRLIREDPPAPSLTPRQLEILQSVMRGLTNPDIARELGISTDRVKEHLMTIHAKLGAANRTEAVAIALRKHLLKL